ncbi:hypothetical protein QQX98_004890 [Neonectria punicea]|uniref:DUF7371 domain-containing protein n=1 Tax=Neonectria punicea TaxID=979145 RepID=A0ABR1H777_9HYPO
MRISASLGAIVATGLLGHSSAQAADYGSSNGPNGIPTDATGNVPPFNPNGSPGSVPVPGTVPGSIPGSVPGGGSPGAPGSIPGGISPGVPGGGSPVVPAGGIPNTVPGIPGIPVIPGIPGGGSPVVPAGGFPGGGSPVTPAGGITGIPGGPVIVPGSLPGPGGVSGAPGASGLNPPTCPTQTTTVFVTVFPAKPDGSSDGSTDGFPDGSVPDGSVPDGSNPDQTVAQSPAPTEPPSFSPFPPYPSVSPFTTLTIDIWGSPDDGTGSGDGTATGDGTDSEDGTDPSDGTNSGDNGTGPVDGSTPGDGSIPGDGTPSDVNGPDDGTGASSDSPFFSPVPAPDTAPEYSGDASGGLPSGVPGDISAGIPGGLSTSAGAGTQAPGPVSSQAPGPGNPGYTSAFPPFNPSGDSGQQVSDGFPLPTQGSQVPGGDSTWLTNSAGNAPLPSSFITITGADGLPTVVNGGTGPLPTSLIIVTGADGLPTVINGGNGPLHTLVTVTGADGLPTVVNGPIPSFVTITGADGLPTIINGGNGPLPTSPVTITGADGLPTVINGGNGPLPTLVTVTGADGLPTVVNGGNGPLPTFATFTGADGLPTIVSGNGPLPTFFTVTGADGLPTVINGGIPGGQPFPSASSDVSPASNDQWVPQGISTGIPLPLPTITGAPGGIPQGPDGSGAPLPGDAAGGVTTCATLTIIGSDGLPTVVDSTWVIPDTAATEASAQLPVTFVTQGPNGPLVTTGPLGGPDGPGITTCTSYTVIGTDGLPTVIDSTWVVPGPTPIVESSPISVFTGIPFPDIPSSGPGGVPGGIPSVTGNQGDGALITTYTSYTVIGTDGLPTVVDSTLVVPGPANTFSPFPEIPGGPIEASSALPNGVPPAITGQPGLPSGGPAGPAVPGDGGVTTCTSYTFIGPDGLPTVVDSTWVIPAAVDTQAPLPGNPSYVSNAYPSGLPSGIPGQITESPSLPSPGGSAAGGGVTTCATYTVTGSDGLPTVVDTTWVVPAGSALPTGTSLGFPQNTLTGAPVSFTSDADAGQFTAVTTVVIIGPDGQPTPVVQTVVLASAVDEGLPSGVPQGTVSGIPAPPPSGPVISSGGLNPIPTGLPSLSEYGAGPLSDIFGSSADAQATFISGTITGTLTSTVTQILNPTSGPIISDGAVPYDPRGNGAPISDVGYGPIPSEITLFPQASDVETGVWTNIIVEPTTTYTINFPLTTMATVARRVIRRQASSEPSFSAWTNSSSTVSLPSAFTTTDVLPTLSQAMTGSETAPTICPSGGRIGNTTLNFDTSKPGPLFNPVEAIWFSEGFHVSPPSLQPVQPYIPTSGGQLVEFVPPALSNTTIGGSGDVAEIGVGPHAASPCFRFDFFGANLGCETEGNEAWCEFEISAYRYNATSSSEQSIAWSETKQVPACSTFSEGGYELTPIELEGYKDLSSVLITLRVGLELRTWWGDDFRVGWTDNSCVAAACRSTAPSLHVKRETVASALRRGIWGWTRSGLQRLDDDLVWESMN